MAGLEAVRGPTYGATVMDSWRGILVRIAEAAGLVVLAYLAGGVIIVVRLLQAGLPDGSDVLAATPSGTILATGGRALLGALVGPLAVLILVGVVDVLAGGVARWRAARNKVTGRRQLLATMQSSTVMVFVPLLIALAVATAVAPAAVRGRFPGGAWEIVVNVLMFVIVAVLGFVQGMSDAIKERQRRLDPNVLAPRRGSPLSFSVFRVFGIGRIALVLTVWSAALSIATALDGPTKFGEVIVFRSSKVCVSAALAAQTADGLLLVDGPGHAVVMVPRRTYQDVVFTRRKLNASMATIRATACPMVTTLGVTRGAEAPASSADRSMRQV